MYKEFILTNDNGYKLKKQGVVSTIIIGGGLLFMALFLLKIFFEANNRDKSLLYIGLVALLFSAIVFLKHTRKFIIYPSKKTIVYTSSFLSSEKEFSFQEFEGAAIENANNYSSVKVGNSFKLHFVKNGKHKEILLGQNVSGKKTRIITEEISKIIQQQ